VGDVRPPGTVEREFAFEGADSDVDMALHLWALVQGLMSAEASAICGGLGERLEERLTSFNGYRIREWETEEGRTVIGPSCCRARDPWWRRDEPKQSPNPGRLAGVPSLGGRFRQVRVGVDQFRLVARNRTAARVKAWMRSCRTPGLWSIGELDASDSVPVE
jgi:hypothetical protein